MTYASVHRLLRRHTLPETVAALRRGRLARAGGRRRGPPPRPAPRVGHGADHHAAAAGLALPDALAGAHARARAAWPAVDVRAQRGAGAAVRSPRLGRARWRAVAAAGRGRPRAADQALDAMAERTLAAIYDPRRTVEQRSRRARLMAALGSGAGSCDRGGECPRRRLDRRGPGATSRSADRGRRRRGGAGRVGGVGARRAGGAGRIARWLRVRRLGRERRVGADRARPPRGAAALLRGGRHDAVRGLGDLDAPGRPADAPGARRARTGPPVGRAPRRRWRDALHRRA